jgi:hypothetical protein
MQTIGGVIDRARDAFNSAFRGSNSDPDTGSNPSQ